MSLVQELENSIDIVELVSKFIRLKKAGTNYKAVCPFPGHSEKTPSFVVSPTKQLAYCFGCHKGGGPLKFIMDLENIEFKEALETLAQITGKQLDTKDFKGEKINRDIYALHKDIVQFYQKSLQNAPNIIEYLEKRGITKNDMQEFLLGYSHDGRELYAYLKQKGYDDGLIDESKVFLDIRSQKDKFLGRVIFPIQNARGDIVGFAGRIVGSGEPKYINSPATKIYDKSSIMYGLFQGKKSIVEQDYVIICEGYMDVIALQRGGFKNTVCVSGTALTEKQITILKRLTQKFYLCFDNDGAGENATKLSLELLKNKDIEVHILSLTGGKDPDEIIKSGGDFQKFITHAISPIGFYLEKMNFDTKSIDEKKKILKEILDILKNYSDQIEREFYIKEISKKLEISEKIIYDEFNKIRLKKVEVQNPNSNFTLEERIIGNILLNPEVSEIVKRDLCFFDNVSTDLKKILENVENIDTLDLQTKENLRGLSLKIEEETKNFTSEKIKEDIVGLCKKLNFDIGNKLIKEYKTAVSKNPNDMEAITKLTQIAKKVKSL